MCGLIAAFTRDGITPAGMFPALEEMRARGPDGEGVWQEDGVALGHRRLATRVVRVPDNSMPDVIQPRSKTGFGIPVPRWLAEAGIASDDGSRSWARYVARVWANSEGVPA